MSQQYSLSPSGGRRITCNVKTDEKLCNYCVYRLSWLSVKRKSLWLWSNSWASLNAHAGSYLRQHETVCQMTKFHRSRGHEWGGRSLSGGGTDLIVGYESDAQWPPNFVFPYRSWSDCDRTCLVAQTTSFELRWSFSRLSPFC